MVNLKRSYPELDAAAANFPVAEGERENGDLSKRSKLSNTQENVFDIPPSLCNPLNEPSPLGLRLNKSPSFLKLIQTRLSQANGSSTAATVPAVTPEQREFKSVEDNASAAMKEKLKASNFSAMLLRIGDWEFVSRFDGDLVAKCYFAKQKLVWEVLQNGMKRKMEIQWPDITALKAVFPRVGLETLSITLGRPPQFFKEINPQPRKHTIWQPSTDFTEGKANKFRQHTLWLSPGVLHRHYEKLIQSDEHLKLVSQQPDFNQSPYFEKRVPFFRNPKAPSFQELEQLGIVKRSPVSALQDVSSSSSSFNVEEQSSVGLTPQHVFLDAPSPCSAMDLRGSEVNSSQVGNSQQLNALGIHKSMSTSDIVTQIGHQISERITNASSPRSKEAPEGQEMLEKISQYLLSDTNLAPNSDEKKLMSRVNSLCCLLQDPNNAGPSSETATQFEEPKGMSKNDSFSDLFHSLPRIASLPKLFDSISENDDVSK